MTLTKVVFPEFWRPTKVSSISSFQNRDFNQSSSLLIAANMMVVVEVMQRSQDNIPGKLAGKHALFNNMKKVSFIQTHPKRALILPLIDWH